MTTRVTINGEPRTLAEPATVDAVVAETAGRVRGVAVAVNETVVPRAEWTSTAVADGDEIEILTAVQGG